MKKYCYIKDGNVELADQDLPINFENVSNFYILSDEEVRSYGWLPHEKVSENKDVFVSSSYEILEDKVIEHFITRDKTEQEIAAELVIEKQEKWEEIKKIRDSLLKETDINVVSDRWAGMSENTRQQWTQYRQLLRDIPQTFEDPNEVVFPVSPATSGTTSN